MINNYDIEDMCNEIADHETEHNIVKSSNMFSYIDMAIYSDNFTFEYNIKEINND